LALNRYLCNAAQSVAGMSQLRCPVSHDLPSQQPSLKIVYPKSSR
jgi:hypothetical protein